MGLDSSDTPPPPSPLINFARLRVQRMDGDHFTLTLARRPLLCPPGGGSVFFGGEEQHGTPLTILNGSGLGEAAAGTPVCVAEAASVGTSQVRVLTLQLHASSSDADGVPMSPLAAGRTAAAVMAEKMDGNHCSQMMVLNDSGVLVCDQDAVWWQLQVDGGGLASGAAGAVFVLHRGHFFSSSPRAAATSSGSAFLPTLVLGR